MNLRKIDMLIDEEGETYFEDQIVRIEANDKEYIGCLSVVYNERIELYNGYFKTENNSIKILIDDIDWIEELMEWEYELVEYEGRKNETFYKKIS